MDRGCRAPCVACGVVEVVGAVVQDHERVPVLGLGRERRGQVERDRHRTTERGARNRERPLRPGLGGGSCNGPRRNRVAERSADRVLPNGLRASYGFSGSSITRWWPCSMISSWYSRRVPSGKPERQHPPRRVAEPLEVQVVGKADPEVDQLDRRRRRRENANVVTPSATVSGKPRSNTSRSRTLRCEVTGRDRCREASSAAAVMWRAP